MGWSWPTSRSTSSPARPRPRVCAMLAAALRSTAIKCFPAAGEAGGGLLVETVGRAEEAWESGPRGCQSPPALLGQRGGWQSQVPSRAQVCEQSCSCTCRWTQPVGTPGWSSAHCPPLGPSVTMPAVPRQLDLWGEPTCASFDLVFSFPTSFLNLGRKKQRLCVCWDPLGRRRPSELPAPRHSSARSDPPRITLFLKSGSVAPKRQLRMQHKIYFL